MAKPLDLTLLGKRYGRLIIIKFLPEKGKKTMVLCKCDCGNEHITQPMMVKRGTTTSCGCYRREFSLMNRQRDILPLHFKPAGEAALNCFIRSYTESARNRGLEYSLTREEFVTITKSNCNYCGDPPKPRSYKTTYGDYVGNGIDRKENSLGYTLENSLPCCFTCNRAKNQMAHHEFTSWIDRLVGFKKTLEKDEMPKTLVSSANDKTLPPEGGEIRL